MRPVRCVLAIALASAACSSSEPATSPPTTARPGEQPSPNGLAVNVDPGFSDRAAVVGATLPARVHVTVNGQPAAGVVVSWTVTPGGGSVTPASVTTDATGAASALWTISDTVRANVLRASVSGDSATLRVQASAAPASSISRAGPDSSAVVAGSSVLLTVFVADTFGNAVAGTPVSWTTPDGTLTVADAPTGPSGRAQVVLSTSAAPRVYTVTATSAGLGSATFKIVGF